MFVAGKATSLEMSWRWPTESCCRESVSSPTSWSLRVKLPDLKLAVKIHLVLLLYCSLDYTFFVLLCAGVKKGDRVSIYMPMVVELVVAMLACVRIGAVHSIVVSCRRTHATSARRIMVSLRLKMGVNDMCAAVSSLQVSLLSLCARGSWTLSVHCSSQQVGYQIHIAG